MLPWPDHQLYNTASRSLSHSFSRGEAPACSYSHANVGVHCWSAYHCSSSIHFCTGSLWSIVPSPQAFQMIQIQPCKCWAFGHTTRVHTTAASIPVLGVWEAHLPVRKQLEVSLMKGGVFARSSRLCLLCHHNLNITSMKEGWLLLLSANIMPRGSKWEKEDAQFHSFVFCWAAGRWEDRILWALVLLYWIVCVWLLLYTQFHIHVLMDLHLGYRVVLFLPLPPSLGYLYYY